MLTGADIYRLRTQRSIGAGCLVDPVAISGYEEEGGWCHRRDWPDQDELRPHYSNGRLHGPAYRPRHWLIARSSRGKAAAAGL